MQILFFSTAQCRVQPRRRKPAIIKTALPSRIRSPHSPVNLIETRWGTVWHGFANVLKNFSSHFCNGCFFIRGGGRDLRFIGGAARESDVLGISCLSRLRFSAIEQHLGRSENTHNFKIHSVFTLRVQPREGFCHPPARQTLNASGDRPASIRGFCGLERLDKRTAVRGCQRVEQILIDLKIEHHVHPVAVLTEVFHIAFRAERWLQPE